MLPTFDFFEGISVQGPLNWTVAGNQQSGGCKKLQGFKI